MALGVGWGHNINKGKIGLYESDKRCGPLFSFAIVLLFFFFSSPELFWSPVVRHLSVRLLHFLLLLHNRWANFNQSWHKSSLGKGDSELYKWWTTPLPKGR
jgi:hypothetical protein